MKSHSVFFWLKVILPLIVTSGCIQPVGTPVPSVPPRVVTQLPVTLTPSLVSTSTMVATLSVEKAFGRLLWLLGSNGDCRLPCLWGITPGKSTYQDAEAVLEPLSSIPSSEYFLSDQGGAISPGYVQGDTKISVVVGFNANSIKDGQQVERVGLLIRALRLGEPGNATTLSTVYDSETFGNTIRYYSLENQLSELGRPDSVMIAASAVPIPQGGAGGFDVLVLYHERGVLINYTMQGIQFGTNMRGCPRNAHVEIDVYSPDERNVFFENLKRTDWNVRMDYYRPLEDVTSMSVDDFYDVFRQPTEKCIETPANAWPTPVP